MKTFKIFLLLILSIQISSLESFGEGIAQEIEIKENNITKISAKKDEPIKIILPNNNTDYFITILSLKKDIKISINNVSVFNNTQGLIVKNNMITEKIKYKEELGNDRYIEFNVSDNCDVEISGVLKSQYNEYESVEYKMDSEIEVNKNNFVIFLDEEDIEKFDMKFNFKEKIKDKVATYGFLYLPTKSIEYLVLGKHYKSYYENMNIKNQFESLKFDETAKQFTIENPFYKKEKDKNKDNLAFIFSIDSEKEMVDKFSFTINSEIINVFLIVSIVIALIFAVITFFLIRRKQTTEGSNIEGDNYYKKAKEEKE